MQFKFETRIPIIFILFFIILISNLIMIIPANAQPINKEIVEIRWKEGQEVQEADVSPSGSGLVTFTGTIDVLQDFGDETHIIVNLTGSTGRGWPVTITPSIIKLKPGKEFMMFTANVSVPIGTSYLISDTITVNGSATSYPSNNVSKVNSISGTILIKQFYSFSSSCSEAIKRVTGDDGVVYVIEIKNTGNARDTFGITIQNRDELEKAGFEFEYQTLVDIESNKSQTIEFTVKAGNNVEGGEYNINLSIRSEKELLNTGFQLPKRLPLTIVIEEKDETQDYFFPVLIIGIIFIVVIVVIIILIGMRKSRERKRPPNQDPRMN